MKTLTVIPLATPQTVPQNSLEAVKSVDRLYLQTDGAYMRKCRTPHPSRSGFNG